MPIRDWSVFVNGYWYCFRLRHGMVPACPDFPEQGRREQAKHVEGAEGSTAICHTINHDHINKTMVQKLVRAEETRPERPMEEYQQTKNQKKAII